MSSAKLEINIILLYFDQIYIKHDKQRYSKIIYCMCLELFAKIFIETKQYFLIFL